MKVSALFKIIVKEFKKDIFIAILLFVLVDFAYANFTGIRLDQESGSVLWQGGDDTYYFGFSTVLLKLLNVSVVFMTAGKMVDKLSGDSMLYILARIRDYRKFMYAYSAVVILSGEMLLAASHAVFYCFAGFSLGQAASNLFYLLLDMLGFGGMMIVSIILSNCYLVENSFLYVIAVYLVNTVLPIPILPAMSTVRFADLKSRIGSIPIVLLMAGLDLGVVVFYRVLIKKRRVKVC